MPQDKKITPILLLSDAPTAGTGLGRITNDLATQIATNMSDVFRVATIGYGGINSRHLPYHHYPAEGMDDFVMPTLPEIWEDWAGKEEGVLLTINDLSRMGWLAVPKSSEQLKKYETLRSFLLSKPFQLHGYFPIDASGAGDRLSFPLQKILGGFDRHLAYGKWAAGVVDRSIPVPEGTTHYLPHGIHTDVFYQRDREECRKQFTQITGAQFLLPSVKLRPRIEKTDILVGIAATNQSRKDWATGLETVAILSKTRSVKIWLHTDVMENAWSIPLLLVDHGLLDSAYISVGRLTDDDMAKAYSACDVVLGIGLGEGYGYVHAESQACGTPCIVGSYAGGAELVPREMQVDPVAYRYEGIFTSKRPVFNPEDWAKKAEGWIGYRVSVDPQYDWKNLWPRWEAWLRAGLQ
jgi:glycosyltransferase involved in cell wall biosynthesis